MAQVSHRDEGGKANDNGKVAADKTKDLAGKAADSAERTGERVASAARDTGEQVRAASARVVHDAADQAGRGLDATADTARQAADAARPVAREALKAEADLGGLWLTLAREQLQHNVDTLRRLGAVRDWRELVELQGEYVRVSAARAMQGVFRQFDLAGRVINAGRQAAAKRGA